jgi:Family of unknown function (DUF5675)
MDLILTRGDRRQDGIFSTLCATDPEYFSCVTLEHAFILPSAPLNWMPAMPDGIYRCQRGTHRLKNLIPFITFEVMGVPGHTGILFHVGNFDRDTEGCILLGRNVIKAPTGWWINQSRLTFNDFMGRQLGLDEFSLTVNS